MTKFEQLVQANLIPLAFVAAGIYFSYLGWLMYRKRQREKNKTWREVPQIKWNNQGMALITDSAVTTTPFTPHHTELIGRYFPDYLAGFIANLSPGEISTILLEVQTHTNKLADEKQKDILRACTIAAARYGFLLPIPLVCLDARTHALYSMLSKDLEMQKVSTDMLVNSGGPEPAQNYLLVFAIVGHILMHYASKGPYPSVQNFLKTVNRNLKGAAPLSDESTLSVATAWAGLSRMPLPHRYHRYNEITDAVYNSNHVHKVVEESKPRLTLVK